MKSTYKHVVAIVAVLVVAAFAAPISSAQSPSLDGYVPEPSAVQAQIESSLPATPDDPDDPSDPGDPPVRASTAEELPFTGLDLGLLGVAGASLLLVGFGMRRLTRGPDSA